MSRLNTLKHELAGTASDFTKTFAHNPASQIVREVQLNDAFAYLEPDRGSTSFFPNGLNQIATISGPFTPTYDANGNLTIEPWTNKTFTYDAENKLTAATAGSASATLTYDPLLRLATFR